MRLLKCVVFILAIVCSINIKAKSNDGNAKNKTEKSAIDTTPNEGEVIMLNKADFLSKIYNYEKNTKEWVYEDSVPCIVDFYATWCGPCKRVAPIMDELASKYNGKIKFYKIDVDKEKELAKVFGVSSIPAFFFIPVKGMPKTAKGSMPRESFVKAINDFLLKDASGK